MVYLEKVGIPEKADVILINYPEDNSKGLRLLGACDAAGNYAIR